MEKWGKPPLIDRNLCPSHNQLTLTLPRLVSRRRVCRKRALISVSLEENKDLYVDTMRSVSESNDWTAWCMFFLEAVEKQAIRNLSVTDNIGRLYETMKHTFSESLASKFSVNALDFVFTNPVFRNSRFTQNSGIPASTAARFTRVLLVRDLLTTLEEPSGRRPALYAFEPLLQLVRV